MYQIGQKLFVDLWRGHGQNREMTITKIGRKWLELDGGRYRAAIDGLAIDGNGYSSPGQAYLSEAAYAEWSEAQSAWSSFAKEVRHTYRKPDFATVEKIKQARELLGL